MKKGEVGDMADSAASTEFDSLQAIEKVLLVRVSIAELRVRLAKAQAELVDHKSTKSGKD